MAKSPRNLTYSKRIPGLTWLSLPIWRPRGLTLSLVSLFIIYLARSVVVALILISGGWMAYVLFFHRPYRQYLNGKMIDSKLTILHNCLKQYSYWNTNGNTKSPVSGHRSALKSVRWHVFFPLFLPFFVCQQENMWYIVYAGTKFPIQ